MLRRTELLEALLSISHESYSGIVFRATRIGLQPSTPSTSGGRWMPPDHCPTLYTCLSRDGALAEISFRQSLLDPIPSKPIFLHQLRVDLKRVVHITKNDLEQLGVSTVDYDSLNYAKTQEIGEAAWFLDYDGVVVPSARWPCENLIIFADQPGVTASPIDSEQIDWKKWASANGRLPKT